MSLSYACLQLRTEEKAEAARERIIGAVTAAMERQGLIPCDKESAERTVAFASALPSCHCHCQTGSKWALPTKYSLFLPIEAPPLPW